MTNHDSLLKTGDLVTSFKLSVIGSRVSDRLLIKIPKGECLLVVRDEIPGQRDYETTLEVLTSDGVITLGGTQIRQLIKLA